MSAAAPSPAALVSALVTAVGLALLPAAALAGEPVPPPIPPLPADAQIAGSVSDIAPAVADLQIGVSELNPNVADLDTTSTQGTETVVSLSTDVLFDFGKSVLPPSAPARLGQLVTAVPRGGTLKVHGFTDSIGTPQSNLELSRARADAVATAIRGQRADLTLDVQGFGEQRPVAPNSTGGEDDPDGRAKNRRVELRFAGS